MCTNFTPTQRAQWVKEKLGVDLPSGYPEESYPGFAAPVVVKSHQTERVACGLAHFGLIPTWAKDDKISRHTYNARSESAAEKPSYPRHEVTDAELLPFAQGALGFIQVRTFRP